MNTKSLIISILCLTIFSLGVVTYKLDQRVSKLETSMKSLKGNTAVQVGEKLGNFFDELEGK